MRLSRIHAKVALALVLILILVPLLAVADVPRDALRHQRELTRHARAVWGLDAPVAMFAAQVHQESRWRANAQSPVGAQGMAQFMPATATWISGVYKLGEPQPYNTGWALRALVTYDNYLWQRITAANKCERAAMTLSAYNGGLGWVYRDQTLTLKNGHDRNRWFGNVELFNAGRSAANFAENRDYPRAILTKWQSIYSAWGGEITCG